MSWTDPDAHVFAVGEKVTAATLNTYIKDNLVYLYNLVHAGGVTQVPAGSWSTSSTSLVDWNTGSAVSTSFTKRGGTETQLFVSIHCQGVMTVAADSVQLGVRVGSTDYSNSIPHYFTTLSAHREMTELVFVSGLAAGTYTCKLRALVTAGVGTFNIDGNDFAQLIIQEVSV